MSQPSIPASTGWTKTIGVSLLLACLIVFAVRMWGVDKGIYLLDEPYYFFTYAHPHLHAITFTGTAYIIHALFNGLNPDAVTYRLIHIWIDLAGGIIFFAGFYHWLRHTRQQAAADSAKTPAFWTPITLLALIIMGNLVTGFLSQRSISYYSLNNFLMLGAASAWLAFLAEAPSGKSRISLALVALAGLATGLDLIVRFPSGILLLLSGIALIMGKQLSQRSEKPFSIRRALAESGVFIAGILLGLGLYFGLIQSPNSFRQQFVPLLEILSDGSHSIGELLKLYVITGLTLINVFVEYHGWVLLLWITGIRLLVRWPKNRSVYQVLRQGLLWGFPLVFMAVIFLGDFNQPTKTSIKAFWLLLVCTLLWRWPLRESARTWLGLGLLFAWPWLGAIGTNLSPLTIMYKNILPWITLLAFLLDRLHAGALFPRYATAVFGGLLLVIIGLHGWYGFIKSPEAFAYKTMMAQTEAMPELPRMRRLKVDSQTRHYLLSIKALLDKAGYQPGKPLLAFYRNPGLVYMMGGEPFGGGYYLNGARFDQENCFYLNRMGTHDPPHAVLMLGEATPAFRNCLKQAGVDLRDYQEVGIITTPEDFYYLSPYARHLRILKKAPAAARPRPE